MDGDQLVNSFAGLSSCVCEDSYFSYRAVQSIRCPRVTLTAFLSAMTALPSAMIDNTILRYHKVI